MLFQQINWERGDGDQAPSKAPDTTQPEPQFALMKCIYSNKAQQLQQCCSNSWPKAEVARLFSRACTHQHTYTHTSRC